MNELDAIPVTRKTGEECLHTRGQKLPFRLRDFWSWANSDILNNTARGVFAEFLVASALDIASETRVEWDAKDLVSKTGIKIEIKSAAYIQSWKQEEFSEIIFDIAPKYGWHAEKNEVSKEQKRICDVYVFCLLAEKNQDKIDPLDVSQWKFYVLSSRTLNEKVGRQKTLSLNSLEKLKPELVAYENLASAVECA